jgi:hypothetical protein
LNHIQNELVLDRRQIDDKMKIAAHIEIHDIMTNYNHANLLFFDKTTTTKLIISLTNYNQTKLHPHRDSFPFSLFYLHLSFFFLLALPSVVLYPKIVSIIIM